MRCLSRFVVLPLFAATLLAAGAFATNAHAQDLEIDLELSPLDVIDIGRAGKSRLTFPEARTLQDYGMPRLPYRNLQLLIPRDQSVARVWLEVQEEFSLGVPNSPLELDAGQQVPDQPVLMENVFGTASAKAALYPPVDARLTSDQFRHGYHLVGVDAYLVRQDQASGEVRVATRARLHVELTQRDDDVRITDRLRHRDGWREEIEARLASRLDNPGALVGYHLPQTIEMDGDEELGLHKTPSFATSPVDMVIITDTVMLPEFQRLAAHRDKLGTKTLAVTLDDILANYRHGLDDAETIRMFVQDAYTKWGIDFVLIGGDAQVIPPRYATSNFYPPGGTTDIPSDLYYSCLDGNWNDDGDETFGEPFVSGADPGDVVDLSPELSVGRAPVSTLAEATIFVDKVIEYEIPTNVGYQASALFASEVLFPQVWSEGQGIQLDGATFSEDIVNNILTCDPFSSWINLRYYENDTAYPGAVDEIKQDIIDSLNTGNYGVFNHIGHGFIFNMSVGDANIVVANVDEFVNAPNYFVIYALNCDSAAFDFNSLMERFVQVGTGGAVAAIGSTRPAFPNTANNYQQEYYRAYLCEGLETIGESIDDSRTDFTTNTLFNTSDRWTHFVYSLIGDPSMRLWSSMPRTASISAPASANLGDNSLSITVTDVGAAAPFQNVTVCLTKNGEDYAAGVTDAAGMVTLDFAPETLGNITVWVSGNDANPISTTIPVTDPSAAAMYVEGWSISDDNVGASLGNGNGRMEPGERIELTPMMHNGGTSNFPGGTATLSLNADPYLTLVDATAAVPAAGASVSVAASDAMVIDVDLTLPDGHEGNLTIVTDDGGAGSWTDDEVLLFEAGEIEVLKVDFDDTVFGNSNQTLGVNERVDVIIELKNFGGGAVQSVTGVLTSPSGDVIIHDGAGSWGAMPDPLSIVDNDAARFSVEETSMVSLNTYDLTLTDDQGRITMVSFDLIRPNPVSQVEPKPTGRPGEAAIQWAANTDLDILGYRVYRRAEGETDFAVASDDIILTSTTFLEIGLPALTTFEYQVVGVDTGKLEGPAVTTVSIATSPPEISCFPLPLAQETSGDLAVWHMDGDGIPEMVIGADQVYGIDGNCNEFVDGDGDAQTFGPIESIAGKYGPASIALGDMDGTVYPEIVASSWDTDELYVFDRQGNVLPGWPVQLMAQNWGTPAVGDLDNDGDNEIVVIDTSGWTYAFHHDGTEVADGDSDGGTTGPIIPRRSGENFGRMSVALYDADGDNDLEILLGSKFSSDSVSDYFDVVEADGSGASVPGWPYVTGTRSEFLSSPTVADIDNDGTDEIIALCENDSLYVWEPDGTLDPGWPKRFSSDAINASRLTASVAVGNFIGDAKLEMVVAGVLNFNKTVEIRIIDTDGNNLSGWPKSLDNVAEASPVVGDINGDGLLDVVFGIGGEDNKTNALYAWNLDGTDVEGFPIFLNGFALASASLGDFNGDGNTNVMLASWDKLIHVWDMGATYDESLMPWPTFRGNVLRNGVFDFQLTTDAPSRNPYHLAVLEPNYPNPFNPSTSIRFEVPTAGQDDVKLDVYDSAGRHVRSLVAGAMPAGPHQVTWNGRDDEGQFVSSGVYFARLDIKGQPRLARKMALIK